MFLVCPLFLFCGLPHTCFYHCGPIFSENLSRGWKHVLESLELWAKETYFLTKVTSLGHFIIATHKQNKTNKKMNTRILHIKLKKAVYFKTNKHAKSSKMRQVLGWYVPVCTSHSGSWSIKITSTVELEKDWEIIYIYTKRKISAVTIVLKSLESYMLN